MRIGSLFTLLKKIFAKVINPFVNTGRGRAAPGTTSLTLLERARAENPEAWSRLVDEYAPAIYRWCRNDGLPSEDAKDATQDVLLKVCKKLKDFSKEGEEATFRGWLRRIARNEAMDYWKRARSRPNRASGGADHPEERVAETAGKSGSLDPRIEAFLEITEKIRERCGEKSWAIFTYYVMDGFTPEETSREFGVSVAYVHQVRARMLHRFRVAFERECPQ